MPALDFMNFLVTWKEAYCGDWSIESMPISPDSAKQINFNWMKQRANRFIVAGKYTCLKHVGKIITTDTPADLDMVLKYLPNMNGTVLINGIKLGVIIKYLMGIPGKIKKLTVVEPDKKLLKLVSQQLLEYSPKFPVEFVHSEYLDYVPTCGYDYVFHNCWSDIKSENLEEMRKLFKKYKSITGYQHAWWYHECLYKDDGEQWQERL